MNKSKKDHKMKPSNIIHKLPTIGQFEKIIDPIINTAKIDKKIGPPAPILPEYLTEMSVSANPFSEIKHEKIKELKSDEKNRKDFDIQKIKNFPINENVTRDTRIKFNANYLLKKFKHTIDMEEITSEMNDPRAKELCVSKVPKNKFISNYDFIVDKRKVCLLDLAINIKEEQFTKLENIVREEDRFIREENERLQKEHDAHDQYLKSICQKTSDAIKLAEKETSKKNKVAEKVKRARYNMAHLNAECVKLEEEYIRLKTYKEFLRNCHKQRERKQALERTSLMNELKIDAILKEVELDRNSLDEETDSDEESFMGFKRVKRRSITLEKKNNANSTLTVLSATTEIGNSNQIMDSIITKETLIKLKKWVINSDFNSSNSHDMDEIEELLRIKMSSYSTEAKSSITEDKRMKLLDEADLDEDDMFFDEPQDLVNILSELEANNLSLIENVQEQEEMCDQMRNRIQLIKNEMHQQIELIDKHITKEKKKIAELEDSINCIKETEQFLTTFNDLDRYKKIFYFGDLDVKTPDEMMDYLHEKISVLYHSVFEKVDSTKSNTVEMLKRIESLVDSLYIELQSHGRSAILKAKKVVDERKREAARLKQKDICREAELWKIKKAMEKAKMPPRFQFGRRIVFRSEPPKEVAKVEKVNWDEVRQQEENAFFFT